MGDVDLHGHQYLAEFMNCEAVSHDTFPPPESRVGIRFHSTVSSASALDSMTRCPVPASSHDELCVLSVLKTNPWGAQPSRFRKEAQFYCSRCLD